LNDFIIQHKIDHHHIDSVFYTLVKPQFRVKSVISVLNNLKRSNEFYEKVDVFHDLLGYRYFIVNNLDPELAAKGWQLSEENHVGHYQYNDITELQVWSLVMYAGLALEHSSIYKSTGFVTQQEVDESKNLRQLQLQLQREIDKLI
jgi:hypothetical protein